jgi:hypothetical protein
MLDVFDARPEVISAVLGVDLRRAQSFRSQRLGRDGIMNTPDDLPRDPSVLGLLGIPAGSPQSSFVSVQSTTQRIVIRVRVGDLERELSAVTQGAIGSRTTAILWMSETNPIVDQTTQTKPITQ